MSSAGLSKTRLGRLREVMAGFVERGEVPGLVALISRRGETHVEALGTKALDGSDPVERDTIFRIASMTKPITAGAAMILVEECKLRLDDPVDRLLPELADRRVLKRLDGPLDETESAKRPITLRDLLTLSHGLWHRHGAARHLPDPNRRDRAAAWPGVAAAVVAAGARRVDPPFRHIAADTPAGRKVDVSFRVRRAGRADSARLGSTVRDLSARTHL
jgi:CubicO group peptidase (beta-lactamase class C family)